MRRLCNALMTQTENASAWPDHKPTALLVLADGTVLEGFGLGAEGHAVGDARRARGDPARRDYRPIELPRLAASRFLAEGARHYRPFRHRHPRADRADPEQGHAECGDRARRERRVRSAWPQGGSARMAGPRGHGPGADGDFGPALHLG